MNNTFAIFGVGWVSLRYTQPTNAIFYFGEGIDILQTRFLEETGFVAS